MVVVTADEMRALDAWTIRAGTPGRTLMQRAATGAVSVLGQMTLPARGSIVIVCGKGNNGGDGFVMARLLRARRRSVETWLVGDPGSVRGDAAEGMARWRRGGGKVQTIRTREDVSRLVPRLEGARVVVDALLGTGLSAPVDGVMGAVIDAVNRAGRPVLAIDIASGLSADSGRPLGTAVQATTTASIGFRKVGQCQYPGIELSGHLVVVDIGIPPEAVAAVQPRWSLLTPGDLASLVPRRPPDAHKGSNGHVLVIAGSPGKLGAALLAATAALRGGAGLTTLAVPASLWARVDGRVPEVMTTPLPDEDGTASALHPAALEPWLTPYAAIVCGPGLGVSPGTRALVTQVLTTAAVPIVLDADGLNAVARTDALRRRSQPTILTPHPGEMSRLAGLPVGEVQADRLGVAERCAKREGAVVVLKGAGTVLADPQGTGAISLTGNPAMATGGMGDVLAGLLGALLAQGLRPEAAARLGIFTHGLCGDRAAKRLGRIGLMAGDLVYEIPGALEEIRSTGQPR